MSSGEEVAGEIAVGVILGVLKGGAEGVDWRDLARDFADGQLLAGWMGLFCGLEWPS